MRNMNLKFINENVGGSIVELALLVPLLAALAAFTVAAGRTQLDRRRVLEATRFGAALYSTGYVDAASSQLMAEKYLAAIGGPTSGRVLIGSFRETPASHFYHFVGARTEWQNHGREHSEQVVAHLAEHTP